MTRGPLDLSRAAGALEAYDNADDAMGLAGECGNVLAIYAAIDMRDRAFRGLADEMADATADRNSRESVLGVVSSPAGVEWVRACVGAYLDRLKREGAT